MTPFITWKYCLQRLISNNGFLLVNIPEREKDKPAVTNNWKLQNPLTNSTFNKSFNTHDKVGFGGGVTFGFFCFDIFFVVLAKIILANSNPLWQGRSQQQRTTFTVLTGNLIPAEQTPRIQTTALGAVTHIGQQLQHLWASTAAFILVSWRWLQFF